MDKPTERQPLDDFFRRNLNDASVPPSTDGWTRLQGRLSEQQSGVINKPDRRIGAAWYWSASIAAACLLVVYFWVNSSQPTVETTSPDLANTTRPDKKIEPKSNRNKENLVVSHSEMSEPVTTPTDKVESSVNSKKPPFEKELEPDVHEPDGSIMKPRVEVEQASLIAKNTEKQPEKIQAQSAPERAKASTNGEALAKATQPSPERTLIVSVVEATSNQILTEAVTTQDGNLSTTQEAPVKTTRLAHVFRQIKRLKDGEALAKADVNSNGDDEESGLFNRLVRSARPKENQDKQQK